MNNSAVARRRPAPSRSPLAAPRPAPSTAPKVAVVATPRALVRQPEARPAPRSIAAVAYASQDLYAIAQIAHHYLMNGATDLARTLLEGLVEVAPDVAHFPLLLGLACHQEGDLDGALYAYRTAAKIDPRDARALINCAELLIEDDNFPEARSMLIRAAERAEARDDALLLRKANGLIRHLDRIS